MKIHEKKISFLNESLRVSGYPFRSDFFTPDHTAEKRAVNLGHAENGSGHDCFLKGVSVFLDIEAPQYWWMQFQRYHFADIISSQSKMHRLTTMNLRTQCNSDVAEIVIIHLEDMISRYLTAQGEEEKSRWWQKIMANTPGGLKLRAGVITNYLQLKTIVSQRKNHRMKEWKIFIDEIMELEKFREWTQ